jgi:hypothetical protein
MLDAGDNLVARADWKWFDGKRVPPCGMND